MQTLREIWAVLRAAPAANRAARTAWQNQTPQYRAAWRATPLRERWRIIRPLTRKLTRPQ